MEWTHKSYRLGYEVIQQDARYSALWREITDSIEAITDEDIIDYMSKMQRKTKSLSICLNALLKINLEARGWSAESPIFQDQFYKSNKWRLDFAKGDISVEVGFNHGEAIAWNLLKPVLASELNHVKKAIQTSIGVLICATGALKERGGFDSAVGEFEKIDRYLDPLRTYLTVPMVIIGLEPPKTFYVKHEKDTKGKKIAKIVMDTYPGKVKR